MSFFDAKQIEKGYIHLLKSNQRNILLAISRCLVPDRDNMRVILDEARFSDELRLMKYYTNIQKNRSLLSCIAPIAFTNSNINEIIVQSSKAFKILTGHETDTVQKISMFVLLNDLKDADIKQELINFDKDIPDKKDIIEFQKAKIKMIISLDKKDYINEIFENLYQQDDIRENDLELFQELKAGMSEDMASDDEELNIFDRKMLDYIIDIRNFKITRSLYNEQVKPLDLIKHEKNDSFYIPVLGNVSVLDKVLEDNILKISIKAKSGVYDFKFIKN